MRRVLVRSAFGDIVEMIAVDESESLVYVVAPDALEKLRDGLTDPVGVPREDVQYHIDIS